MEEIRSIIEKSKNKTKFKLLFLSMLNESKNGLKLEYFWKNGGFFKFKVVKNTILNKYLNNLI